MGAPRITIFVLEQKERTLSLLVLFEATQIKKTLRPLVSFETAMDSSPPSSPPLSPRASKKTDAVAGVASLVSPDSRTGKSDDAHCEGIDSDFVVLNEDLLGSMEPQFSLLNDHAGRWDARLLRFPARRRFAW